MNELSYSVDLVCGNKKDSIFATGFVEGEFV